MSATLHQGAGVQSIRTGLTSGTGLPSAVRLGLGAAQWPERPKERKGEVEWESRVRGAVTRSRAAAEAQRTTQVAR